MFEIIVSVSFLMVLALVTTVLMKSLKAAVLILMIAVILAGTGVAHIMSYAPYIDIGY